MISKARIACCNSGDGFPGRYRSQEELTLEQRREDIFLHFVSFIILLNFVVAVFSLLVFLVCSATTFVGKIVFVKYKKPELN